MKILVIEDEAIPLMLIGSTLTDCGHEVKTASRADVAIEIGLEFNPDIIVSDWKLKDKLDGIQVCERILEKYPGTVVIMISACSQQELLRACTNLRPASMMEKPLSLDHLIETIETVAT